MVVRWIAMLMLAGLLVPVVQAGPAERACHAVVDNPYAPLLADCGPVGAQTEAVYDATERACRYVNDEAGTSASCWYYRLMLEDPVAAWNVQCRWVNGNPEEAVPELDCYL